MVPRKIFLSYRRDDSSGHTELLFSRLASHYGQGAVFRDVHAIHPMDRFREVIHTALVECGVVCVVIGKNWTQIVDANGAARLQQPDNVVCWEISCALDSGIPVLPLLVGGARMPKSDELPESIRPLAGISALEISDKESHHGFEQLVAYVNMTTAVAQPPTAEVNPFSVRAGIRNDAFFFDRMQERNTLRDYLRARQNCQVVGPRRIGKSSILLFAQRHCAEWCPSTRVAYFDLQDPRCFTLAGWLNEVVNGLQLPTAVATLSDLMEAVEDLLDHGIQPVLCLDEFGEMAARRTEFTREVFLTLRSCGQKGMSIITAAPKRLSQLTDPGDDTSPFFNTFPILTLKQFSPVDARAFVDLERQGMPQLTETEKLRVLEFSQGHPLALQAACYHVLAARISLEPLSDALARAREDCGSIFG